jgi:hypothetical protein
MELALEWLESQRVVMNDPALKHYFLQYNYSSGGNGVIFNAGRAEGAQYFWNYMQSDAAQYYISSVVASLSDNATDGTFTDDVDGLPAEHPDVQAKIGMTDQELEQLRFATQSTSSALIYALVASGKFNWQAFGSHDTSAPAPPPGRRGSKGARNFRGAITPSSCAAALRAGCAIAEQARPLLQHHDAAHANQSVAAFLITRPPIAFLGYAWESDDRDWDPLFLLQAGEPVGLCEEGPAGVFSRQWSLGKAQLDCNTFTASLPFESL